MGIYNELYTRSPTSASVSDGWVIKTDVLGEAILNQRDLAMTHKAEEHANVGTRLFQQVLVMTRASGLTGDEITAILRTAHRSEENR